MNTRTVLCGGAGPSNVIIASAQKENQKRKKKKKNKLKDEAESREKDKPRREDHQRITRGSPPLGNLQPLLAVLAIPFR